MVILNHSLPGWSNVVSMAPAKVDQGGNKSNNVCSLPSQISKISDKISQKINPHKFSKDFDVQNPEKIINNGATTHRHARPQKSSDPRISHSNLCRSEKNFTKLMQPLDPLAHDLQNLKISSLKMAVRTATRRQNLSIHRRIVLQICANLFKISHNWPYRGLQRP